MAFREPVADIAFALKHAAGLGTAAAEGTCGDSTVWWTQPLAEARRFATSLPPQSTPPAS
jgi:hypothetical protein